MGQRSNFAVVHMMAASQFARLCYAVEEKNKGLELGSFFEEIRSYVVGTILSSVASIESNINEVFADLQDHLINHTNVETEILKEIWPLIEQRPILEKYEFALVLNKKRKMDKGVQQYNFVNILIKVRNALVHFKPEWHDAQQEHNKIGKQLQGKFEMSPFLDSNNPIFPLRCMTHGFADWAIRSCLDFAEWFAKESEFPNRYVQFLNRMNTKP